MLENLHKISLTFIEKAPITQPNIYSLALDNQLYILYLWRSKMYDWLSRGSDAIFIHFYKLYTSLF